MDEFCFDHAHTERTVREKRLSWSFECLVVDSLPYLVPLTPYQVRSVLIGLDTSSGTVLALSGYSLRFCQSRPKIILKKSQLNIESPQVRSVRDQLMRGSQFLLVICRVNGGTTAQPGNMYT